LTFVHGKKRKIAVNDNEKCKQKSKSKREDNYMKQGDTNVRTIWTSMKIGVEIRCSERVSMSCSVCGMSWYPLCWI